MRWAADWRVDLSVGSLWLCSKCCARHPGRCAQTASAASTRCPTSTDLRAPKILTTRCGLKQVANTDGACLDCETCTEDEAEISAHGFQVSGPWVVGSAYACESHPAFLSGRYIAGSCGMCSWCDWQVRHRLRALAIGRAGCHAKRASGTHGSSAQPAGLV